MHSSEWLLQKQLLSSVLALIVEVLRQLVVVVEVVVEVVGTISVKNQRIIFSQC